MTHRTARELADIAAHRGHQGSAYLIAMWENDWRMEAKLEEDDEDEYDKSDATEIR